MAAFIVRLTAAKVDVFVNFENVTFIRSVGQKCTIYFGNDHSIQVDQSAYEVLGLTRDGTLIPEKS
jgi:hypothetical protein